MKYILLLLALVSCQNSSQPKTQEAPQVPVHARSARVVDVPVYVEALGTLRPSLFVDVHARVDGILSKVLVAEGEWVEEGMCLFEIDPKPFAIKVEQAKAQGKIEKARLQAALKKMSRFKSLHTKNLISQNEWDALETDALQAKASLELARNKEEEAQVELEYCRISAPQAGRIGKIDKHIGQRIVRLSDEPLAQIVTMDPLLIEFSVTERDFCRLSDQSKNLELELLSFSEKKYSGTLTFTDNHFDEKTGQILLRGKTSNKEQSLRPGMSMRVKVPVSMQRGVLAIPQRALKHNQYGAYLYVVQEDQTVILRHVEVGCEFGEEVLIQKGIGPDDLIITEGHERVAVGGKVMVKELE